MMKPVLSLQRADFAHHKVAEISEISLEAETRKISLQTSLVVAVDVVHARDRIYKLKQLFLSRISFGTTLELRLGMDRGQSQNISARVPAGVNDGAKIRVKGKVHQEKRDLEISLFNYM
jgi:hypothetical protein